MARIALTRGGFALPFHYEATPWRLRLCFEGGRVDMVFDAGRRLLIEGSGTELTLEMSAGVGEEFLRYDQDRFDINSFACQCRLMFQRVRGELRVRDPGLETRDQPKSVHAGGGDWALVVEEYTWAYQDRSAAFDLDGSAGEQCAAFEAYARRFSEGVPARFRDAARQAAYINWSATVPARGLIPAPVMLMSKNWMTGVWIWDSAINAVACAGWDDEAAWNNLISPFLRQHESGRLLDLSNARTWVDNYTKPPIHGWAVRKLRQEGTLTEERRAWIYPRLLRWTQSWYDTMDWDHDGVCQYNHGNDSGWDNCTNPSCVAWGEEKDMDMAKALLHATKESIINIYVRKTDLGRNVLAKMMDTTTWLDAEEALEKGFIDGITGDSSGTEPLEESDAIQLSAQSALKPAACIDREAASAKVRAWIERQKPHARQAVRQVEPTREPRPKPNTDSVPAQPAGVSRADLDKRLSLLLH